MIDTIRFIVDGMDLVSDQFRHIEPCPDSDRFHRGSQYAGFQFQFNRAERFVGLTIEPWFYLHSGLDVMEHCLRQHLHNPEELDFRRLICVEAHYAALYLRGFEIVNGGMYIARASASAVPHMEGGYIKQITLGHSKNAYTIYDASSRYCYDERNLHNSIRGMACPEAWAHVDAGGRVTRLERRVKKRGELVRLAGNTWPGLTFENFFQHCQYIAMGRLNPLSSMACRRLEFVEPDYAALPNIDAVVARARENEHVRTLIESIGYMQTLKRLTTDHGRYNRVLERNTRETLLPEHEQPNQLLRYGVAQFIGGSVRRQYTPRGVGEN